MTLQANISVSTHSHPKVAADLKHGVLLLMDVSTHSHPKVAANGAQFNSWANNGFNTQPPEGGCSLNFCTVNWVSLFQHTATRRWLQLHQHHARKEQLVSTHSHPKVAACHNRLTPSYIPVSTHSHPKVAAFVLTYIKRWDKVSTHSHPKVAALFNIYFMI